MKKIRTVLLAALALILSSMALSAVSDTTIDNPFISPGYELGVNATVDSTQTVYSIIDKDKDSEFDNQTDPYISNTSITAGQTNLIGQFGSSVTEDLSNGNYTVYSIQSSSTPSNGTDLSSQPSEEFSFDEDAPQITDYSVERKDFKSLNLSFKSSEKLSLASLELDNTFQTLDVDLGNLTVTNNSGTYYYNLTYYSYYDTIHNIELQDASDRHGNDGSSGETDSVDLDPILSSASIYTDNGNIKLKVESRDSLSELKAQLEGVKTSSLTKSDFDADESSTIKEYVTNLSTSGDDGFYNVTLNSLENSSGTEAAWNQTIEKELGIPPKVDEFSLYEPSSQDVDIFAQFNEQVSKLKVNVNGTVDESLSLTNFTETSVANGYNYTAEVNAGVDGYYNASLLSAEDNSGNSDTYSDVSELNVDTTPPTISNFAASNTSSGEIFVTFNSSEKLDTVKTNISGAENITLNQDNFSFTDSTDYNYTSKVQPGSDGDYTVVLEEAIDGGGNDGSSSESDSLSIRTPPRIDVFSLLKDNQDVDLRIESTQDLTSIGADLGGDTSGSLTLSDFDEKSTDPWIYEANVSSGSDGTFNATLTDASDADGNDGSDGETDEINVDTTPPQDPTSTDIVNEPINLDNEDSLETEIYFNSKPEDGVLTVKVYDGEGNTVTASGFVDTSTTDQTVSSIDVQSLEDGQIWTQAKIEDNQQNENPSGFTANSSKTLKDTNRPQLDNVITGEDASYNNTDAKKLTVEYTEDNSIDSGTLDAGDFLIDSGGIGVSSVSVDSQKITVTLGSSIDTDKKPTLEVDGSIRDSAGNKVPEQTGLTSEDGLKPELEKAVVDPERSDNSSTVVELTFSEDVMNGNGVEFAGSSSTKVAQGGNKIYLDAGSVLETGNSPQISSIGNVTDTSGNTAESTSKAVSSFETSLSSGWDTFSLPVEETQSYSISNILDESSISAVWNYESGEWKVYSPGATGNDFSQFEPGKGYLVNSDSSQTVTATVDTRDDGSSASISIENGWNLVANMQEYSQSADTSGAFSGLSSIQRVKAQNSSGDLSFERIGSGSSNPQDVEPGKGYWLKSGSSDSLTGSFAKRPPTFMSGVSNFLLDTVNSVSGFIGGIFG